MTTMEPMKKMTRRNRVVWLAFGMALSGSLVSSAVTPISSVPEKAKFTVSMVVNTGIHPLGNIRPSRSSRIAAHGHTLESAARRTPRNRL